MKTKEFLIHIHLYIEMANFPKSMNIFQLQIMFCLNQLNVAETPKRKHTWCVQLLIYLKAMSLNDFFLTSAHK
jgi:hypothetical protein